MTRQQRIGVFGLPVGVVAIVIMLVVPLPTMLIDLLISVNIAAALVILLTAMHIRQAKEFSVFPSVLLVATLFRLALNVSVTRSVLLHGYAGSVVQSFGNFVVGGQVLVGLVVFLILIVIQFVVVTNGAGRVSEVAARFSLDAMGPKLVAIDSDLNQGHIKPEEAVARRHEIEELSDFYGAMDGASKFVRGDAIAALIITAINLIGGLVVGIVQHHLSVTAAGHTYSILSVGDGLVSQIPALFLSISTGLVVTRGKSSEGDLGSDVVKQFAAQYRGIRIAGAAMVVLGIVPGLPHLPFFVIGIALLLLSQRLRRSAEAPTEEVSEEVAEETLPSDSPAALVQRTQPERLELELSADLTPLADTDRGGILLERIRGLREKIAQNRGFVMPTVRTHDNLYLPAHTYAVKVNGVEVARGLAYHDRLLAIGESLSQLPGIDYVEPTFGLPAKWIPIASRDQAAALGVTPVDPASVVITHLDAVVAAHADELLSTQTVQQILDAMRVRDPAIIEEMNKAGLSLSELHRVLVNLIQEGAPITDRVRILEAVVTKVRQGQKSIEALVEAARTEIGPQIVSLHLNANGRLPVITLDAGLEQTLARGVHISENGSGISIDPTLADALVAQAREILDQAARNGNEPVLLVNGALRPAIASFLAAALPRLAVLSVSEVRRDARLERCGRLSGAPVAA